MKNNSDITPISSFVIKIASRCNLNCTYCYEFNMGDTSWMAMPKMMSLDVFEKVLYRIKEHCSAHSFDNVSISLHGGEPLLVRHERFEDYLKMIKNKLRHLRVSVGLQTNGLLIDNDYIELFEKYDASVGVSLDGIPETNDKYRVFHSGKGSGKKVENKLRILKKSKTFGGILSVIDLESNPIDTWRYLASFDPPVVDFLLPHAHWENTTEEERREIIPKYGDWLIEIFDDWFDGYRQDIRIRFFEEILYRVFGQPGTLESLGLEEISLITVASNGDYEQVDTMKSVFPGAHTTSLNVWSHTLDDVLIHNSILARQSGMTGLCDTCKRCEIVNICGGGYYPHRYSDKNSYSNPSVYCNSLMNLIEHIQNRVTSMLNRELHSSYVD